MTENSTPGIYTQPDGDADDVLGHRQTFDKAADKVIYQNDEDDVEGHRQAFDKRAGADFIARDRAQVADDEDDVEGHRQAFDKRDRV